MNNIFMYVSGILLVALMGMTWLYENTDNKLTEAQNEMLVAKMNNTTCKAMLAKQNTAKALVDAELSKNMVELHKWKAKPDIIKYKYIYRELPKDLINATCEDITASVRNIDLNGL